jgi:class 3 adenylate cyclase
VLPAAITAWIESASAEPTPIVGGFEFGRAEECNICKYLGDGFLAYWVGGVNATDRVVATVQKLGEEQAGAELPFRFVLHYGEFTITTEPAQGVESLLAPAVHYVFRAEKVGGTAGKASLFTAAAREAIGARLSLARLLADFELKGFAGRHVFFTLQDGLRASALT